MFFFQAVNAKRHCDIEFWALIQNARNIWNDPLLDAAVRHQVDGFELVVFIKGAHDFRQIFAREWLTPGQNQDR